MFFDGHKVRLFAAKFGLILTGAMMAGCQQKLAGPVPRYAVVRFENLSGEPAVEWMGLAATELLSGTLSGAMDGPVIATTAMRRLSSSLGSHPAGTPGISSERVAAQLAGATRIISGYIERTAAGVRVTSVDEDVVTRKIVRTVSAVDSSPLKALNELARSLSPKAGAYQTASEEALRLYCIAREAPPEAAAADLEQSVQADGHFGPAWETLIQVALGRGDRQAAENLIAKAREQKLDKLSVANLDLESAALRGDQNARLVALKQISTLSPGDTVLRRSVAELEASSGQFAEAAVDWRRLREVLPADADASNQLGYTLAWSGDYAGAVRTMEEYARLRPADPNPLDSLGDVHFMYRKFTEAAGAYQQAYTKLPAFQNGGDLYKAAVAKYLAGEKAGADAAFAQFRKVQEKNENFPLLAAEWLYRTGRQKQAQTELRGSIDALPAPVKPVAFDQLAIWELLAGNRAAALKDAEAAGPPGTPAGFLVRFATLPSASPEEWEARANRMLAQPAQAGLRRLAVGYALLLDGKKSAAMPVWKQISEVAPASDFDMRSVYSRLQGQQPKLALLPTPSAVNPFAAVVGY